MKKIEQNQRKKKKNRTKPDTDEDYSQTKILTLYVGDQSVSYAV